MDKKSSLIFKILTITLIMGVMLVPGHRATAAESLKVGLVVDSTGIGDNGWNALAYHGILEAQIDYGILATVYASDDFLGALNSCVANGNALCITNNWEALDAILLVAAANPGVKFTILDSYIESPPANLRYVLFDEKQVGYLAGTLAADMTSTDIVGAVGGMDITPVVDFLEGYEHGAQCTNSNVIVLEKYTGSFIDPALGATTAADMISNGADVIFGAAGSTGNGAILFSAQHDIWSIGVDTDQYLSVFGNGTVKGSNKLLTSAMKNFDNAVYWTIQDLILGVFTGGGVTYDLEDGGVGLAPFHEADALIPQAVKDHLAVVSTGIINGTIQVDDPCAITIWYPYQGAEETALHLVVANAQAHDSSLPRIIASYRPDALNEFQQAVLNGWGPDLLVGTNDILSGLARSGALLNLNTYLAGQLTNVDPIAIDGMKVDGDLFGVPESSKTVALFYNKTTVATPPTTTAELLSLLQGGKTLAAMGQDAGSYYFYGFWNAFGGQLMNNSGLCIADQGGVSSAMQYLKNLQTEGAVFLTDYASANEGLKNGTYDMLINGPWAIPDLQGAMGDNLGVVILPQGPSGPAHPMAGIDGFFINGQLPSPPEVIQMLVDLALYMTNQTNSQTFTNVAGHTPVRSDVSSSNPLINAFKQATAGGEVRPQVPQLENYWVPFNDGIKGIFEGTYSPLAGIRKACADMNEANGYPSVSGTLSLNGAGGKVTYSGGWTNAETSGDYKFYIVSGWTGTITPSRPGYVFTPSSLTVTTGVSSDLTGMNFNAAASASFSDVPTSHWAWSWIERLYSAGITTGCAAGKYCPESQVTRAEMAVFLERGVHGASYAPPAATGIFGDVPTSYWAANFIEQLYADGITTGCILSPLLYCPGQSVTRAEMAAFLLRAKHGPGYAPPAATGVFSDVPTSHWAANWIEQLYAEGITTGCNPALMQYCPANPVTRAEMAAFLVRTFELP